MYYCMSVLTDFHQYFLHKYFSSERLKKKISLPTSTVREGFEPTEDEKGRITGTRIRIQQQLPAVLVKCAAPAALPRLDGPTVDGRSLGDLNELPLSLCAAAPNQR